MRIIYKLSLIKHRQNIGNWKGKYYIIIFTESQNHSNNQSNKIAVLTSRHLFHTFALKKHNKYVKSDLTKIH